MGQSGMVSYSHQPEMLCNFMLARLLGFTLGNRGGLAPKIDSTYVRNQGRIQRWFDTIRPNPPFSKYLKYFLPARFHGSLLDDLQIDSFFSAQVNSCIQCTLHFTNQLLPWKIIFC